MDINSIMWPIFARMSAVPLEAARARGKKGGRKPKLNDNKKKAIYELYQQKKMTVKDICDMFGITKPTLYKAIEEVNNNSSTENIHKK